MHSAAAPALQSLVLGGLFVLIAAISDCIYALAAGAVAPRLQKAGWLGRAGRYASGGAFIGLGLLTAISGSRTPKP
jgi:threonine/homoserine/homoserine lactone efflux protein